MHILIRIVAGFFALLAGTIGVFVIFTWREMRKQRRALTRVSIDGVVRRLPPLLHRSAPGTQYAANANDRDGFLQMVVSDRKASWRRIEFGLPDAEWARPYFNEAVVALQEHASEWLVEPHPENPAVPRFLRIWIEGEEAEVCERTDALLRHAAEALGFPAGQTYDLHFEGSDHPDYLRSTVQRLEKESPGFARTRFGRWVIRSTLREAEATEHALRSAGQG
jgi:hypothetical protein